MKRGNCLQLFSGLLMVGWLLTACNPVDDSGIIEVQTSEYLAGKQKMREGDVEGALHQFLKAVEKYSYSPESHLEVGIIYLQYEDEPILAIYHLNRYLELKPEGRESILVKELILSAKKQFAASLPGNPFKQQVSRMELLETIAGLKRRVEALNTENLDLKQQVDSLSRRLTGTQDTVREILAQPDSDAEAARMEPLTTEEGIQAQPIIVESEQVQQLQALTNHESPGADTPEVYQVKAGDSLYAISMKFYGDATHIQSIFQANRNVLRSIDDLRPGQVLKLPK